METHTADATLKLFALIVAVTPLSLAILLKSGKAIGPGLVLGVVLANLAMYANPGYWLVALLQLFALIVLGWIYVTSHSKRTVEIFVGKDVFRSEELGPGWWSKQISPAEQAADQHEWHQERLAAQEGYRLSSSGQYVQLSSRNTIGQNFDHYG